ncbi:FAD-dependent oxidoreductase [Ruficoccus sp. ZRK36]|uniref:FAD-dependent oxidoreductase n=1 Tax=Ruficoccus sp. ZRK36 TaxID=2866311 RepID=UPI001C7307C6|nr:FAD-dependent oxidoreductase [Ruficoccus sp. ZRK36]QYY35657.1 FAD-dependent oxidoreductase [Ruficoccus sp. ZRK36]
MPVPSANSHHDYDLIVIGAGSGGFGAAYAASRMGCRVLLVEKNTLLGGNATHGGVNVWEPGVGGTGIPFELYKRLKRRRDAVGIYSFGRHMAWHHDASAPPFPGGELILDPTKRYLDTLRRYGAPPDFREERFRREHWHGVPFEPEPYAETMREMLEETGHCSILTGVALERVQHEGSSITGLTLSNGARVSARFYVDATASLVLAKSAGCTTTRGQEAQSRYHEKGAPATPGKHLNGASLLFRVMPAPHPCVEPCPDDIPRRCWWQDDFPAASCVQYPGGGYSINPLPTMEGREALERGHESAYGECLRRIRACWRHMQLTFPEFQSYQIAWVAPTLGIREGTRLVGRYVLTEHDLDAGLSHQTHDDIIAISDHAKDIHGGAQGRRGAHELAGPYGIPYRCLLPQEFDNMLVACRGASFSAIAASSCRLSRTMMQLGQAAGTAAALATCRG